MADQVRRSLDLAACSRGACVIIIIICRADQLINEQKSLRAKTVTLLFYSGPDCMVCAYAHVLDVYRCTSGVMVIMVVDVFYILSMSHGRGLNRKEEKRIGKADKTREEDRSIGLPSKTYRRGG